MLTLHAEHERATGEEIQRVPLDGAGGKIRSSLRGQPDCWVSQEWGRGECAGVIDTGIRAE